MLARDGGPCPCPAKLLGLLKHKNKLRLIKTKLFHLLLEQKEMHAGLK
jgi:hypothetical protein